MSVSVPSHKHFEIWHMAHSFLKTQPVIIHKIVSYLGTANFCASGHAQLCWLYHVIQNGMLNVYHCLAHVFHSFNIFSPALYDPQMVSVATQYSSLQFPLPSYC